MTRSPSPGGDETGVEQEGIWEAASPAAPSGRHGGQGSTARASRELTSSITSTRHLPGPAGLQHADVPNRTIALILDIIVLSILGFVLAWLLGGLVTRPGALDAAGGELDVAPFLVVLVVQLVVSLGYFGASWVYLTSTPGMRLLGLRIGDEAAGQPISWRQALMRWLLLGVASVLASMALYVPAAAGVILSLVGGAWLVVLLYTIAQSPTRQGLHDRVARTILVRRRQRAV